MTRRPVQLLLVEDNPGDVVLVQEAFREIKVPVRLLVAEDGEQAMAVLRDRAETAPDLILLDLNLPRKSGIEILSEIKEDERLKTIPVVVLTTSLSRRDILQCYARDANCYVTKPIDFEQFISVVKAVGEFWLTTAKLPGGG